MINPSHAPPAVGLKAARSPEELFPLVDLCRAGKLKEVGEWIAAGKPLDPPLNAKRSRRQSPLEIAIDKGFFALTELLLDGGCDPTANGNALCDAVRSDQPEIAKLLLDRGVPADSIHLSDVFDAGRQILELFIERGVDPSAENAYYDALCTKVHPLLFVLKDHKERFPELQRQAEMALCHHCENGNARNVGLLLWAGARADAQVPDPNFIDGESTTNALSVATRAGRVDILKQLKPEKHPQQLQTLFADAWLRPSAALFDYLIGLGAPINTKANGGCGVIEHLLWRLGSEAGGGLYGFANPTRGTETIGLIDHLCRCGGKLVPDESETVRHRRVRFRKIAPENIRRLFRIFRETDAASVELLDSIIGSPALRKSLGPQLRSIEEIIHPAPAKKVPESANAGVKVREGAAAPSVAEMRARAEELLLDVVRQEPSLHFTRVAAGSYYEKPRLRKRLGMPKDDDRDIQPIIEDAVGKLNRRLRTFRVKAEWNGRTSCRLEATLNGGNGWTSALAEAWASVSEPNELFLTDAGLDLRNLILSGALGSDWSTERSITFKIGLHGREHVLEPYVQEIENKTGIGLSCEREKKGWPEPTRFRITVRDPAAPSVGVGVNPRIDLSLDADRKGDRDSLRRLLYDELLRARPQGNDAFFLFTISSREELDRCLPRFTSGDNLARFFHALTVHDSLKTSSDLRSCAKCWFVAFSPAGNWPATLKALKEEISQPSVAERYGVSPDAAKLLEWIQALPKDRFTGPWTPILEDAVERWIGIRCPWGDENFAAFLQMLLDELNDRTEYILSLQPWRQHGAVKSRICVRRKRSTLDDLILQLQAWALRSGIHVDSERARASLESLLGENRI